MKQEVKDFLVEYAKKNNRGTTDNDLWEILIEEPKIYSELECEYRWWDEWFYVVQIEDKYIGYIIDELGYDKDLDSICFCNKKEIIETIYIPI